MKRTATFVLLATAIGAAGVVMPNTASAQVNCGAARTHEMRVWCYQQSMQIYRQQSQMYNDIARQQYRTHQNVGTALRYAPLIGRYAAPAWNAPRYYYDYRYGRP
jgi:hypothetical protein